MPSIIMKNLSTGFIGEKNDLRVCHKSKMICKRSSSHANASQLAEDLGRCTQNSQYVSSSCEGMSNSHRTLECGSNQELASMENSEGQEQSVSQVVTEPADGRNDTSVSSSANPETIFSPLVNNSVNYDSSRIDDDEGSNVHLENEDKNEAEESDGNSAGSSSNHTCNVSDFFISDMILGGLQFDGSIIGQDDLETSLFQDYNTVESSFFFDTSEQYFSLSFLDDSLNFNIMQKNPTSEEAKFESFGSSLYSSFHQMSPGVREHDLDAPDSEQTDFLNPLSFIRNLPDLSDVAPAVRPTIFLKESPKKKPVTLVLDLDETLVHSSVEYCEDADFTFKIFFNMKEHIIYVKERPYLHSFLKRVAEIFDVVVFTASQRVYAEELLNVLDPEGNLITGRAYRESCIFSNDTHTKDLTVLGLDLAKVAIIDNTPQVFRLQVNNGIPIKSWFDDPLDRELVSLVPFLETLANVDDVRPVIAQRFGNKE